MRKFVLIGLLVYSSSALTAMRIPEVLSQSLYTSDEGFSLNPKDTSWIKTTTPNDLKDKVEALFRTKTTLQNSPTFTVRVDKDTQYRTLKEYSGKWLKGFGQFGLEVLGHQYFKNKENETGFVVDLANSTSKKKLRQAIFFKNAKAVILTCMDQSETFKKSIKPCNELIQTFSWNEKTLVPAEKLSN